MGRSKNRRNHSPPAAKSASRPRVLAGIGLLAALLAAWLLWPQVAAHRRWRLAEQALEQRDFDQAAAHLEAYCRVHPHSDHAQFELARALRRAGRFDAANRELESCNWVRDSVSLEKTLLGVQQSGSRGARSELVRQISVPHPEKRLILEAMVIGDRLAMDLASVKRWLDIWCKEFPDDAIAFQWRGDLELSMRQFDAAHRDYLRVVELQPGNSEAWTKVGEALLAQNAAFADANAHFLKAVEIRPDNAAAWLGVARCRLSLGDAKEAETAAREAWKDPSQRGEASLLLAMAASDQDRLEDSLKWLEQAQDNKADRQRLHYQFAAVLKRLGRTDEAEEHDKAFQRIESAHHRLEAALERVFTQPDNPEHHHAVGMLYLEMQQTEQAKDWFARALHHDRSFEQSRAALARLQSPDADGRQP